MPRSVPLVSPVIAVALPLLCADFHNPPPVQYECAPGLRLTVRRSAAHPERLTLSDWHGNRFELTGATAPSAQIYTSANRKILFAIDSPFEATFREGDVLHPSCRASKPATK